MDLHEVYHKCSTNCKYTIRGKDFLFLMAGRRWQQMPAKGFIKIQQPQQVLSFQVPFLMFTSLVRRHWTVEPSLTAMESWIPNQRCLWDNGEGCMHIFCRNCPKTLGTLREDMEFGQRQTLKKKKHSSDHWRRTCWLLQNRRQERRWEEHTQSKSKVHTPRQTSS